MTTTEPHAAVVGSQIDSQTNEFFIGQEQSASDSEVISTIEKNPVRTDETRVGRFQLKQRQLVDRKMPPKETTVESILDALQTHVVTQGDVTAYTFLKSDDERLSITYRELDQRARRIAHRLLQQAAPGDRALMMYPAGLDFVAAFLGCLYAGIVAVPAYPPKKNRNTERILSIANDCTPRLLLCTSDTKRNVEGEFAESVSGASVIVTDEIESTNAGSLPQIHSDQLAFLQYTSGSTAAPKGVMVTHDNIVANGMLIQRAFEHDSTSVVMGWLPIFHDMGLIGNILQPLLVGCRSILMTPNSFLREPLSWLKAVTEFGVTSTGAPNFAYNLCTQKVTEDQKQQLDLSSLKIACNGAEPVRAQTLERFSKAFAGCGFNRDACVPSYGMAETTLLVSGGPPLVASNIVTVDSSQLEQHRIVEAEEGQQLVSCGQVGPDLQIRIVDPETLRECDPNVVGEIWVHGASITQGYWNRPQETQEAFRAKLDGDDRDWFRTGDYGFLRDGELYVTGRLKDLIIIHGRNIYPQDIEQAVEQHLNFLGPNSCAAFSTESHGEEQLTVVAEGTRDMVRWVKSDPKADNEIVTLNQLIDDLRAAILDKFEVVLSDLVFVRPTTFPRTSSGKVQRTSSKRLLANDEFEIVLHSTVRTQNKVENSSSQSSTVIRLICETLQEWATEERQSLPALEGPTTFASLGIDSMAATDVGFRLEKKLGITVEGDTLYQQQTIEKLGDLLSRRIASSSLEAANDNSLQNHSPVTLLQDTTASQTSILGRVNEHNRRIQKLRDNDCYYYDTPIESCDGAWVVVEGRRLLMLASYNYLGFVSDTSVLSSAHKAIDKFGIGQHGSRLISGTTVEHKALERELAEFMRADDSIIFNSGYVTNLATIAALVGKGDTVIGDEWNHACIVDGCRLSGAAFQMFRHNDLKNLEQLLSSARGGNVLVVVDAVYSMEGDIAPIPEIVALCKRHGALLMVDEAHSIGTIGKTGRGVIEHFDLPDDAIDIKMGTLSKSLGACGGFIASSGEIVEFLRHNSRGYVFSVAPPTPLMAATRDALSTLQREPQRAIQLMKVSEKYRKDLCQAGFDIYGSGTQIVPIACDSDEQAYEFTKRCRELGVYVIPIVYPAVPMNAPRIRTNLTMLHTEEDVNLAVEILVQAAREVGVID